jgi:hypothetical protein
MENYIYVRLVASKTTKGTVNGCLLALYKEPHKREGVGESSMSLGVARAATRILTSERC